ncbi:hypothetical protein JL722_400 [Aureococcus anophagefferens]|nr:hypothetical protein JL722_400 [Aureococcus anophagefferens]
MGGSTERRQARPRAASQKPPEPSGDDAAAGESSDGAARRRAPLKRPARPFVSSGSDAAAQSLGANGGTCLDELQSLGAAKISRLMAYGIDTVEALAKVDVKDYPMVSLITGNKRPDRASTTIAKWRDIAQTFLARRSSGHVAPSSKKRSKTRHRSRAPARAPPPAQPAATAAAYEFPAPFDADDELAATDALLPPGGEETPFARENSGSDGEGKSDDTFESSVFEDPAPANAALAAAARRRRLAVDSFWAPFNGEVDVAVDAFDFAGASSPAPASPSSPSSNEQPPPASPDVHRPGDPLSRAAACATRAPPHAPLTHDDARRPDARPRRVEGAGHAGAARSDTAGAALPVREGRQAAGCSSAKALTLSSCRVRASASQPVAASQLASRRPAS